MRTLRLAIVALLSFAAALPAQPSAAKGKQTKRHFDLRWIPSNSPSTEALDLTGLGSVRLKVVPLTDERKVATTIGENREKGGKGPLPVTTDSDVAAFVTEALREEMRRSGLPLQDDGSTHVLSGSIQELSVVLDGTYKSSVRLRLTLEGAAGNEKWTGLATGTNTRFSMMEGPENYLQSLGDALLEAIDGLVRDEAFLKALRS